MAPAFGAESAAPAPTQRANPDRPTPSQRPSCRAPARRGGRRPTSNPRGARTSTQVPTSTHTTVSTGTGFDHASGGLAEHAIERGWWKSGRLDFTRAYLDDTPTGTGMRMLSLPRAARSDALLREMGNDVTVRWMMRTARDESSPAPGSPAPSTG